ncbi:MAG: hypothetical protein KKB50_16635 [Planctomycetes bacterium]|nr:hypothetical protein [Planctomycetota bacterium]
MADFISEPIVPQTHTGDTAAMGRGEPGLPRAFAWREAVSSVVETLQGWKQSQPEGGRPGGERYLRRHYYRLRMSDDSIWTVYFIRHTPKSGSPKQRWFLYSIET